MSTETMKALRDALDAHIADEVTMETPVVVTDWVIAVELSGLVDLEDENGQPESVVGSTNVCLPNPDRGVNSHLGLATWMAEEIRQTVVWGSAHSHGEEF